MKPRILRITTVPISLQILLEGQFVFLKEQGFEVLTASADGPELVQLKRQGVDHVLVPLTRKITPLQDLYCIVNLVAVILRFRPGIVHTHTPKAGLLGMIAAWLCRVPVRMHTVAGLPLMEARGFRRWILKQTERVTYACAHHVYPNSTGLATFMATEFGLHPPKLRMIGQGSTNGIDAGYFSKTPDLLDKSGVIRKALGGDSSEVVFSFVGRINTHKGIVELVEAFQKLSLEVPARLLLVGAFEPELDPLPAATMQFLKTDRRVTLAGFQQDVRPWLLASDIFVFPSYREGFPNVVMQAASLEVPAIVTDINGSNEIIQQGITGLVVPVKQVEPLRQAMVMLARDASQRAIFSRQAREFVTRGFDRKALWDSLLAEYRRLLPQLDPAGRGMEINP